MTRKMFNVSIIAFAMIATMALVGAYPTTVAAEDEKKPVAEAPLSPETNSPVRVTYSIVDGDPCVTIEVINGGATQLMIVFGEWKQTVSFRLRTDKEPFAEKGATWAKFFGNPHKLCSNAFASAVIVCPDEECLKAWTDWYPKACQEAWDRAHPKLEPTRIFPDGPRKPK